MSTRARREPCLTNAAESAGETLPTAPAAPPSGLQHLHRAGADGVFALLLLALLLSAGWLAARHDRTFDWSSSGRNSLSAESIALLERLPPVTEAPLRMTVFAPREHPVGRAVEQLLARYRRHRPDLDIQWVDPQRAPELARNADVRLLGQVLLEHRTRRETLRVLSEGTLSSAIARLTLERAPWVAVLEGHGERALNAATGSDVGRFGQLLQQRGFRLQSLDLARAGRVPDNVDLLLITTPSIPLFPGEAEALVDYLAAGGNLLWLLDPGAEADDLQGLQALAAELGIQPLPGLVVDAKAAELGFDTPTFAVLDTWPDHPVGLGPARHAVLPGSLAFQAVTAPGWRLEAMISTGAQSWNETGPVRGAVTHDAAAGETLGPLPVALTLSRPRPQRRQPEPAPTAPSIATATAAQRVLVVGDGDFVSNAHLSTADNLALGLRMARWLTGLDDLITPPPKPSDTDPLVLSGWRSGAITLGGVLVLPALLAVAGLWITWRRGRA